MAAAVADTKHAVDEACRTRGYSCQVVSWDDVSRGTVGDSLSCWGANITDTYLKSKDGTLLFTVRPNNWNEKLGRVTAGEVAVVSGNHVAGGGPVSPVTLRDFLKNVGNYGAYAGLSGGTDLSKEVLDGEVSIRFQTTFLPVSGSRGTMEFATEAYNYNTLDDADPRNLVLLCTSQGVAVQQDGKGAKRLLHHAVDGSAKVHRYWLEAERSEHKVGGSQKETVEERQDAVARGKATASVIGTRAMGTRFNVLMTIQVPLQQKKTPARASGGMGGMFGGGGGFLFGGGGKKKKSLSLGCGAFDDADDEMMMMECGAAPEACSLRSVRRRSPPPQVRRGTANAARVSRGSEFDVWGGLSVSKPERHAAEHVTVTVVIYNTIADGVPTVEDVAAAIDDLEDLYAKCGASGQLADATFDFMKEELAVNDANAIGQKLTTQPYKPSPTVVENHDVFPT